MKEHTQYYQIQQKFKSPSLFSSFLMCANCEAIFVVVKISF